MLGCWLRHSTNILSYTFFFPLKSFVKIGHFAGDDEAVIEALSKLRKKQKKRSIPRSMLIWRTEEAMMPVCDLLSPARSGHNCYWC